MARRRWLAMVVAVAAAGGCAALASGQSPGVAYGGLSSQRLPFTLTLDGQALSLDITWMTTCGGLVRTVRPAATTIGPDGAFAWTGTFVNAYDDADEDRQRLALTGHRDPDGALSGVWHADRDSYNGEARAIDGTCSSGDVAFRATPAGSTSQPGPQRDGAGQLVTPLEGSPARVAAGAGKTWVLGQAATVGSTEFAPTLTAVDQQTGVAETPMRVDGYGLAAGAGAVYLLSSSPSTQPSYGRPRVRLVRVDASSRAVTRGPFLPASLSPSGYEPAPAVAAGGVWLLSDDRVVHLDPGTGRLVRAIRVPADRRFRSARRCSRFVHASPIALDGDSVRVVVTTALHCRSHASPRSFALARTGPVYSLASIDARTSRVTRVVSLTRQYTLLAAGAGGVWGIACLQRPVGALLRCRRPALHRIDLRTGRPAVVVALPAPALDTPVLELLVREMTVGAGAVWVLQPAGKPTAIPSSPRDEVEAGVLRRVDIATRAVSTVRAVARLPAGLVSDEHGTWLLDDFAREIVRVTP